MPKKPGRRVLMRSTSVEWKRSRVPCKTGSRAGGVRAADQAKASTCTAITRPVLASSQNAAIVRRLVVTVGLPIRERRAASFAICPLHFNQRVATGLVCSRRRGHCKQTQQSNHGALCETVSQMRSPGTGWNVRVLAVLHENHLEVKATDGQTAVITLKRQDKGSARENRNDGGGDPTPSQA